MPQALREGKLTKFTFPIMVLILTAQLKFSLIFTKLAFVFKFVFLQRIPKKFISEYGVDLSDMAFLTIPNGTKWKVKLIKHNGEVCFQNGWCKFASCHALTLGNLLVFRYEGNLEFSVLIFDATATEINYPTAEVQVSRMEDNESDDNSLEIIDDFMPSRKKGEKPPIPCPLPHKKAKTNPSSSKLEAGDTHFRPELTTSKGSMLEKSKMVFGELVDFESVFTINFMYITSYFHVISGSAHRVGGVAKNLMRANALKSENLLFTVIIHPSYINGKDRAVSFLSSTYFWILEMQLPLTLIFHRSIRKHVAETYPMALSTTYREKALPRTTPKELKVVDRLWPVKLYVYEAKYLSCVISAGWSAFASRRCFFVLLIPDRVSTADHQLVMAPKRAKRGKSKAASEPEVSTTGDVPYEDMHGDPTAAVAKDSDDEVDVDTAIAAHTGPRPPFLRAMMETIMTTQTTHGQVLYGLLTDVAALQADLADYRRPDPPSPTSNS
ncbi:b3 domain-containing protein [Quercus suber]|uniref:B3 domain-containing protein n=1 Tax=Quercus suber TaxID=58331 RepID=A0AAW0IZF7_QUESU